MSGPPDRDRDVLGRPRNARPRDASGRPLPRGSPGVPRVPDELAPAPDEALGHAQQLIDDGQFFQAHEVLEAAWKTRPSPERGLWRALAQLAVGLTHAQRGNRTGAAALLHRAAEGLQGCEVRVGGVDPVRVGAAAAALAVAADEGRLDDVVAAQVRLRG